ncbi:MAG: 1,2-phenylacetyl-CoA epoxidase subunit PaaE [Chitinophagaceae bacterium]
MAQTTFYPLTVREVQHETPHCVSILFHIPDELKTLFQYQAGQYITIKKNVNTEEVRRSYSLCSSPNEDLFRVAVKQVQDGRFSTFATQQLKAGDVLEVMPPMGHFTYTKNTTSTNNHYIALAAGSGITPILSILKTVLIQEPHSIFTLVYGNQNFQSIIFREEIEALKNKYVGRLQVIHILSRERLESELNFGRITKDKCEQLFDSLIKLNAEQQFFLCGPEEMILSVKDLLLEKGIKKEHIKFELFTSDTAQQAKQAYIEKHQEDIGKTSQITIKVDDRSMDFKLSYTGDTILDAALKQGADLPYACKGGVCCTCRAKVVEGSVSMVVNYALEDDEVANGFVLTCQAHPSSEKVVIDFDAR